ncbi:oxidoreductase [Kribbella sancticallisti]|uniref:Oxidoreductase n=1 Tax=Kribbella sancticallisti TaxID=460087 RepID=A0ABP4NY46_9ACTN
MSSVIITGAGSGIGASTALHLDRLGWQVFAGVHDQGEDSEILARQSSDRMTVLPLDVTDRSSVEAFVATVEKEVEPPGLTAVVNNAGEGIAGPLETLPIDELRHQFEVNVIGLVRVTQQALPLLRRGPGGRVVFVGSMGGLVAVQFAGAYHASKYAVEAIGDAWRQELAPDGIHVAIVEPGPISTPLWSKAAHTLDRLPPNERYQERLDKFRETLQRQGKEGASPQSIAELIEHAVSADRPKTRYAGGFAATVVPKVRRLLPDRLYDKLARRASA